LGEQYIVKQIQLLKHQEITKQSIRAVGFVNLPAQSADDGSHAILNQSGSSEGQENHVAVTLERHVFQKLALGGGQLGEDLQNALEALEL